jgi:hypothetical protein
MLLSGPTLLGGLGADAIDGFLATHPSPSSTDVAEFLKVFPESERLVQAQALLARGVSTRSVSSALNWLEASGRVRSHDDRGRSRHGERERERLPRLQAQRFDRLGARMVRARVDLPDRDPGHRRRAGLR